MLKCSLDKIQLLFAEIAKNAKLYLPVDNNDGTASYAEWSEGVKWSEALNTNKSPKDFFFPQTEDLMRFKTEGKNIEVIDVREKVEPFVVFGVRACDVKSFDILDRVFLTEPRDSFYAMKREQGIIVSLACTKPAETCFCTTFGIDAAAPAGDVTSWKTEDALYLQANTEGGSALLNSLGGLLEECDTEAVDAQKAKIKKMGLLEKYRPTMLTKPEKDARQTAPRTPSLSCRIPSKNLPTAIEPMALADVFAAKVRL